MGSDNQLGKRFYFLCVEDRIARYDEIIENTAPEITISHNVGVGA